MMAEQFLEMLVFLFPLSMAGIFCFQTRGIPFFGKDTDNEKQVKAAAHFAQWRWPSDMHQFAQQKSRMKDGVILLLVMMQRILGNKKTDHPLICVCALANAVSAILIYAIAKYYWGFAVAYILFFLFLTCFWHWQIALMGGHICVGQMFFLLSVWAIQQSGFTGGWEATIWLAAAGMFFALTQFSSASSRKFIPFFFAAFFYHQWVLYPMDMLLGMESLKKSWEMVAIGGFFLIGAGMAKSWAQPLYGFYRNKKGLSFAQFQKILTLLVQLLIVMNGYLLLYLAILGRESFLSGQLAVMIGFGLVCLVLLLPDIFQNIKGYFSYFNIGKNVCHFILYRNYFSSIHHPIKDDMRGAGWPWILKYFALMEPLYLILTVVSMLMMITSCLLRLQPDFGWMPLVLIILLSFSPILWAELTRAPQLGRSYYPAFLGQLLIIGLACSIILPKIDQTIMSQWGWGAVVAVMAVNFCWNWHIFQQDVFPARMATRELVRFLLRKKIKKFYTYHTPFNDAFVEAILSDNKKQFEICFIDHLHEIQDAGAVLVVPATSSKALNMESYPQGYENQDFRSDPYLNWLIDTRKIRSCCLLQLKTFGTSRIWQQESEAPTYRDLILKEVKEEDRWRGYAWVVDVDQAKGMFQDFDSRYLSERPLATKEVVSHKFTGNSN